MGICFLHIAHGYLMWYYLPMHNVSQPVATTDCCLTWPPNCASMAIEYKYWMLSIYGWIWCLWVTAGYRTLVLPVSSSPHHLICFTYMYIAPHSVPVWLSCQLAMTFRVHGLMDFESSSSSLYRGRGVGWPSSSSQPQRRHTVPWYL